MNDTWLHEAYEVHGPAVMGYLRGRLRHLQDCEEILQQTFVVIAENPAGFHAAASPRAWLIGIARNVLRDHLRRRDRRNISLTEEGPAVMAASPDERLEPMRQAIAGLPAAHREVLELRLREDLSYAEIAEALAIPVGTVRSRLHHAVAALRREFNQTTGASTDAAIPSPANPARR